MIPTPHFRGPKKSKVFWNRVVPSHGYLARRSSFPICVDLLGLHTFLQRHYFYQLRDGTSLWNSPWCATWNHIYDDLIIQPPGFTYPATPKDLWIPNQKVWNNQLIDSLFSPRTATIIKNTAIIQSDQPDILCWQLTPNGKCNSKSAYKACLQVLFDEGMPSPAPVCNQVKIILK
jgi:hypothetical protein